MPLSTLSALRSIGLDYPFFLIDQDDGHDHAVHYQSISSSNQTEIILDVPGMSREHLQIEANGNILTVRGERPQRAINEDERVVVRRAAHPKLAVDIPLDDDVDVARIGAKVQNGALTLTLPKQQAARRVITVDEAHS